MRDFLWVSFVLACLQTECAFALPQASFSNAKQSLNLTAGEILPHTTRGTFEYRGTCAAYGSSQLEDAEAVDIIHDFNEDLASRTEPALSESEIRRYYGHLSRIQVSLEFLYFPLPMNWDVFRAGLQGLETVLRQEWSIIGHRTFEAFLITEGHQFALLTVSQDTGVAVRISWEERLIGEGQRFRTRRIPYRSGRDVLGRAIASLRSRISREGHNPVVANGARLDFVEGSVRLRCEFTSNSLSWPIFTMAAVERFLLQVKAHFFARGKFEGLGLALYYPDQRGALVPVGYLSMNPEYFAPPPGLGNSAQGNSSTLPAEGEESFANSSNVPSSAPSEQSGDGIIRNGSTITGPASGETLAGSMRSGSQIVATS